LYAKPNATSILIHSVSANRSTKAIEMLKFGALLGFVLIWALSAIGRLPAQTVTFIQLTQIPTGVDPAVLAVADITGNGKSDLIVANQGAASLSILLGLGNGFFQPFTTEATGISPRALAVGDFNQDGRLDLAVTNFASDSVSIFLGNGNGSFRLIGSLTAAGPSAVVTADFNGDGKLDLAVVETTSNSVSVFLGNGNGGFLSFFTSAVGDRPVSIATADFNGDGRLDLAVANIASNNISILLGTGTGIFVAPRNYSAGPLPAYVALADFDGNGTIDIAVANATGFSAGSISLLPGFGNGAFGSPRTIAAGSNPSFLVTGDFNLDGKPDLAVANTASNTISIFLGLGNGFFVPPIDFITGSAPDWISVVDLNADGRPDLLVANSRSNTVSVLINYTGVFGPPLLTSVVNAAALQSGAVAPGELVTIFGANLGPHQALGPLVSPSGLLSTSLANTQVFFDDNPAPLLYASSGQLNAVVPFAVGGRDHTEMVITNSGQTSMALDLAVTNTAPALFTMDSTGQGQSAARNQDGSLNSNLNPAGRGSIIALYATGGGETSPAGIDGLLATAPISTLVLPISAYIDGKSADVLYAGGAPGFVAGVIQVNVRVPDDTASGTVPITLQVGSALSQPGVTVNVD
jgi:uncharacterized protein (TIGR03437 family)